jgi:hypothetical protein
MEGYLSQRDAGGGDWKVRYFRLMQDKLFYFKSHESVDALGHYDVFSLLGIEKQSSMNNIQARLSFRLKLRYENIDLRPSDDLLTTKKIWLYHLQQWLALSNFFLKQTELSRTSLFSYLPESLSVYILSMLDDDGLRAAALVCKRFLQLVKQVRRLRIGKNWKQGTFNVDSLVGHNDKVLASKVLNGATSNENVIYTASR